MLRSSNDKIKYLPSGHFKRLCKGAFSLYTKMVSRAVIKTSVLSCNPSAKCQVHSTIRADRDIYRYLLSIKSLLFYYSDVAIILHDDGLLTRAQINIFESHIKGIRIIDKHTADKKIATFLNSFPACTDYRNRYINAMQLFDYLLLSDTDKVICLDSDTLFLQMPLRIIEWISSVDKDVLCLHEQDPHTQSQILSLLGYEFRSGVCIALMCLYKDVLDLENIEKMLLILKEKNRLDWWTPQNIFAILLNQTKKYNAIGFKRDEYQNLDVFVNKGRAIREKAVFRHYCGHRCYYEISYLEDLKTVLKRLRNGH